jgi:hypothetical protein
VQPKRCRVMMVRHLPDAAGSRLAGHLPGLQPGVARERRTPPRRPSEAYEARRNGGIATGFGDGALETPVTASGSPNSRQCTWEGAPLAGSAAAESSTASDLTHMVRHLAGRRAPSASGCARFTQNRAGPGYPPVGLRPLRDQWPARCSSGPRQPRARCAPGPRAPGPPASCPRSSSALAEMACVDARKSLTLRTQ